MAEGIMTRKLFIRDAARIDLSEIREYYDTLQPGLGGRYAKSVADVFDNVLRFPEMYGVVRRSTRCASVHRFPYLIYYRIDPELITIVSILHSRRSRRQVWKRIP